MKRTTRWLLATTCALGVLAIAGPAAARPATDPVPVLVVDGHGHGHGVGLSQWGAHDMAASGTSAAEILAHYYPGTTLGQASGEVVVGVDGRPVVRLRFPGGGEIRSPRSGPQTAGFPVTVGAGGVVEIRRDAAGFRVTKPVGGLAGGKATPYRSSSEPCLLGCHRPADDDGPLLPLPTTTTTPPPTTPTTRPPSSTTQPPNTQPPPGGMQPPGSTTSTAPPASSDPVSPSPVWAVPGGGGVTEVLDRGRSYRGVLDVVDGAGGLRVRNHVDVETYLKGMAEVPGTWPAAAVQAQAVAARTYALRAGELCDSDRCQVYVGATRESPGQAAAVEATRGIVVTHGGRLASTFYSASGGGHSANVLEGFGTVGDVPYLQARPEPAVHTQPWRVEIALTDVASRLAYPGTVTAVSVRTAGPSGRPLELVLEGDAGPRAVDAQTFRRSLGLRSTLFTTAAGSAATAPPPPPAEAPPDVVGDAAAGTATASTPMAAGEFAAGAFGLESTMVGPTPPGSGSSAALRAGLVAVVVLLLTLATAMALRLTLETRAGWDRFPVGVTLVGWRTPGP